MTETVSETGEHAWMQPRFCSELQATLKRGLRPGHDSGGGAMRALAPGGNRPRFGAGEQSAREQRRP